MPLPVPSASRLLPDARLRLAVQFAGIAFVGTLLITIRAYLREARLFGIAPVLDAAALVPAWMDFGTVIAGGALMLAACIWPQRSALSFAALAIPAYWMLQDWERVQPASLMFLFTILAGALRPHIGARTALDMLRWMVAGVYFWAGFHKLNVTFIGQVFPWFVGAVIPAAWVQSGPGAVLFGFAAILTPYFELLIGLFLLLPRKRSLATGMAAIMLFVVLLCLGPLGHNYGAAVWPWNLFLFSLELLLFFGYAAPIPLPSMYQRRALWLPILIFCLLPGLALFDRWDSYLGFKLYSGNILTGELVLDAREPLDALPPIPRALVRDRMIDIPMWSYRETNHTPYPEERAYLAALQPICGRLRYPQTTILRLRKPAPFYSITRLSYELFPCRH